MNNNVLKILAGVLALGAVIVALIGIRLSGAPSAPAATAASAPAPAASARFVVAARDIQAGRMLESADVQLETAASAPQGSLGSTQQAIGQVSSRDITKGTPVLLDAIAPESLSALLQPGERAVAVQVDEVIGVGGFARPGDFVDVLQFMGATRENQDTSFAQVLVRRARILTFGDATQIDQAAPTAQGQATQEAMRETGAQAALQARERRQSLRSAVLAVRESEEIGDRLDNVVCYEHLVSAVQELVDSGHVNLVETLAERIAGLCLDDPRVRTARVRVEKLDVFANAASVGVEIERYAATI